MNNNKYSAIILFSSILISNQNIQAGDLNKISPLHLDNNISAPYSQVGIPEASIAVKSKPSYFSALTLLNKSETWNGLYIGLMVGYESGTSKFTDVTSKNASTNNIAVQGAGGEFIGGGGKTFNKLYLGLEASASLFNSQGKTSYDSETVLSNETKRSARKVEKKDSFGVSVRGGYKVHDNTLIYVKGGLASSKFNLKSTIACSQGSQEDYARKIHKRPIGVVAGLGSEIKLTERLLGRLEASHIHYKGKNYPEKSCSQISHMKFRSQSNEIKAGIVIPIG